MTALTRASALWRRVVSASKGRSDGNRIFMVIHGPAHVRILAGAAARLMSGGIDVRFVVVTGRRMTEPSMKALADKRLNWMEFAALTQVLRAGDVVVAAMDWRPGHVAELLSALPARQVRTVGIVEGCRFGINEKYRYVERVLVWGRSGVDLFAERAMVVGSVAIEAAYRRAGENPQSDLALINYKFDDGTGDAGQTWLEAALKAATGSGLRPLVSVHPRMPPPPSGTPLATAPLAEMLAQTAALITRPSTTVYEALAAGAQPFVFPADKENIAEFRNPMGAFSVSQDQAGLAAALSDWRQGCTSYAPHGFLAYHVDHQPDNPVSDRIANALTKVLAQPA